MKYFYFTILIPLLHGGVYDQLLQSNIVNIFAQKSEFDNPICYMETTEGKIINLVNLCGDREAINESKKVSCKSESEKVKATEIPISNINYDGNFLTGKVANQSCQTVKQIKVIYQVLDDAGNIIDNGFIYAEPSTVEPGKVAYFKGNVSPGAKVETTFVEWSE
ncbi:MAG: hypothetical protein F6K25_26385 [Okeania sp. SIO2G4]|uniref:FxLYD domain-containing protein n=1 Tax=unclassified Okeania TaxID=2634635 RepID=UPI0013BF53D3|nr:MULTISPECIES: FxLYD domain-containing protein [unclassified Okeania]NEP06924.1 hypothetical protein [Okeania sp. SIO4D6]NEP73371.1 hypothetical protein [Okeania sp. SIO2G5]NEQ93989.1 hypothetical protein [Okeania sp. SIO2G4]